MFHKVDEVYALPGLRLSVLFSEGVTKLYDVVPLMERLDAFEALRDERLFDCVAVDVGGYGIVWNDDLDLSCDELWEHGVECATAFDGLMSFANATELWGLSESTLRKAVAYGKIVSGVDARKFGKQWVVTRRAMEREYGMPVDR
ncbi:MAG: DUF2442 domain-containing protein [Atopobiaceae bacterium]|nr:DUF2442 domain-containing protein [Atopobiaceae bacterium]